MKSVAHSLRKNLFLPVLIPVLISGLVGCATSRAYRVQTYSSAPDNSGYAAYMLVDSTGGLHETRIPFATITERLRAALQARGLPEADVPAGDTLIVDVNYGYEQPRVVTRTTRQIVALPGAGTQSGFNTSFSDAVGTAGPAGFGPGGAAQLRHQTLQTTHLLQPIFLRLTARLENTPEGGASQLWMIEVRSDGEDPDLARSLRQMIAAAAEQIDKQYSQRPRISIAAST